MSLYKSFLYQMHNPSVIHALQRNVTSSANSFVQFSRLLFNAGRGLFGGVFNGTHGSLRLS